MFLNTVDSIVLAHDRLEHSGTLEILIFRDATYSNIPGHIGLYCSWILRSYGLQVSWSPQTLAFQDSVDSCILRHCGLYRPQALWTPRFLVAIDTNIIGLYELYCFQTLCVLSSLGVMDSSFTEIIDSKVLGSYGLLNYELYHSQALFTIGFVEAMDTNIPGLYGLLYFWILWTLIFLDTMDSNTWALTFLILPNVYRVEHPHIFRMTVKSV